MNSNKEIKIFKELSYRELPDYRYKAADELAAEPSTTVKQSTGSPVRSRTNKNSPVNTPPANKTRQQNPAASSSGSVGVGGVIRVLSMCNTHEVTERTNAQTIQEDLDRTVGDITRSLSFSPDVFEERAAEFLPYINQSGHHGNQRCHANLFAIPTGLKKAGTPPCFYSNNYKSKCRATPSTHLPCILKDCGNSSKTAPTVTTPGSRSKRAPDKVQAGHSSTLMGGGVAGGSPSKQKPPHVKTGPGEGTAGKDYEDEVMLSCLSPSTVELIVSRLTQGLQQDRLKKKFQISVKPSGTDSDPIRIF